jgi:tetratricopeptide (TPR) repeat protein
LPARRTLLLGAVAACLPWPALAAQDDPRTGPLLDALARARDAAEAALLEQAIWTIWHEIDDPQSAALLEAAGLAMASRAWDVAADRLDRLVARSPGFAEGWNKRATLRWLVGDHVGSVRDIQRTLALEPRHFGALSGLGLILMAEDDIEGAIRAFTLALALHPFLPGARQNLAQLEARRGGQPL